jgi:hypothetical protein
MFVAIYNKDGSIVVDLVTVEEYLNMPKLMCLHSEIVTCSLI